MPSGGFLDWSRASRASSRPCLEPSSPQFLLAPRARYPLAPPHPASRASRFIMFTSSLTRSSVSFNGNAPSPKREALGLGVVFRVLGSGSESGGLGPNPFARGMQVVHPCFPMSKHGSPMFSHVKTWVTHVCPMPKHGSPVLFPYQNMGHPCLSHDKIWVTHVFPMSKHGSNLKHGYLKHG